MSGGHNPYAEAAPQEVTFAASADTSSAVALDAGRRQLVGLQMPAAWTAAGLAFEVSADGVTYVPLHWSGGLYEIDAAGGADASMGVSLEPAAFAGWPFVRVVSGTTATPVTQAAARTLLAVTRAV